jgi:modification methylase
LIAKPKFKLAKGANSLGDIWEISQEFKNPHPAPFPQSLTDRIIASTNAESVLDPFMGSGTTALSARALDRDFYGIELSELYCDMADRRLNGENIIEQKKDADAKQQGLF